MVCPMCNSDAVALLGVRWDFSQRLEDHEDPEQEDVP